MLFKTASFVAAETGKIKAVSQGNGLNFIKDIMLLAYSLLPV